MATKEACELFNSMFGTEFEEVEYTLEVDGKIYELKGYGTPKQKEPAIHTLVITKNEVTH